MRTVLISQTKRDQSELIECVKKEISTDFDRFDAAVAYASNDGFETVTTAWGMHMKQSRWIIGLNDEVTDPKVLRELMDNGSAKLRAVAMPKPHRFHPKIYKFSSTSEPANRISYIGSGNLTKNGLVSGVESGVLLISETESEAQAIDQQFNLFWNLGLEMTESKFQEYQTRHSLAKKRNAVFNKSTRADFPVLGAPFEMQRGRAVAWLECGSAAAGGRDLEFPKKLTPFFGLSGTETKVNLFVNSQIYDGVFKLRQDNGMWRLLLSTELLRTAIGRDTLRPPSGENRSDLVAVFERRLQHNCYDCSLVEMSSQEFSKLKEETESLGTLLKTSGKGSRRYGWL